ncbi:MAG: DUF2157 domain-containing protein [Cyanobacteria bacterium SID2]|nr:DUF2157 domain-containing protein [Cyanobacteria bacterium SID2]MBP0003850.1 DUF2157 domain-containing protein [Cyanobacteria bacterium SBC]
MTSDKFRRQLRQEAEKWWKDGLIDSSLYGQLAERYRFDGLEAEARSRFTTILIGLGGILLGLGAITFVAANWSVWSRDVKLVLLLGLFLGVNITGFSLWRSNDRGGLHKLGAALLLLGGLVLGADLALVSQMFHQSGPIYQLLLAWSLGVWLMAMSLQMPALAILSSILFGCGYAPAIVDAVSASTLDIWQFAGLHVPLITLVLFVPLAYISRSNITFFLVGVLLTASIVGNVATLNLWAIECAFVLPPALLWAYGTQSPQRFIVSRFQAIARSLAVIVMAGWFYVMSFNFWNDFELNGSEFYFKWGYHVAIDLLVIGGLTLWLWLKLRDRLHQFQFFQARSLNTGIVALMLLATGITPYIHLHVTPLPVLAPLIFNILLFFLAIAAIRDSLALGSRRTFWGGMILLVLGIVTRMLEYDTGLLMKALVFAGCGLGVIAAGLWFERNIHLDKTKARPLDRFNPQPPQEEQP